jgi:hypothetical protein
MVRRLVRPGVLLIALGLGLAGCAVEFGGGGDSTTVRDRSRLYMQEQERLERDRQLFQTTPGSER